MDHNRTYIEELIRKQLLDQLTAEEAIALEKEKAAYTDEQYDLLVIEMLDQLQGQLPEGFLSEWQPDYDTIRQVGDAIRRPKKKTRSWRIIDQSAAMLFVVFFVAALFFIFFPSPEDNNMSRFEGDCVHLASNTDIPVSESACVIYLGDSTVIRVTADQVGEIRQLGNLLISRTKDGILHLERRPHVAHNYSTTMTDLIIATKVREQCVVRLEDGTLMRINAQSYIRYPIQRKDTLTLEFAGEALVQGKGAYRKGVLQLNTKYGWLTTKKSDFVVRTDENDLKVVLDQGAVNMYGFHEPKPIMLKCHENFGVVRQIAATQREQARDSLIFIDRLELASAKEWIKVVRNYKNIPLRAYVEEISRWDGMTIEDWKCLPVNKKVNLTICYRSSRSEILASMRAAGVRIREDRGLISFCPKEEEKWVAMMPEEGSNKR